MPDTSTWVSGEPVDAQVTEAIVSNHGNDTTWLTDPGDLVDEDGRHPRDTVPSGRSGRESCPRLSSYDLDQDFSGNDNLFHERLFPGRARTPNSHALS